jgi:hypothetical protein
MSNDEGAHSDEGTTRAEWKAIENDTITGTLDWEWNNSLPLGNSCNIDTNDMFFDDPTYMPSDNNPTFQVSLEPSLTMAFTIKIGSQNLPSSSLDLNRLIPWVGRLNMVHGLWIL